MLSRRARGRPQEVGLEEGEVRGGLKGGRAGRGWWGGLGLGGGGTERSAGRAQQDPRALHPDLPSVLRPWRPLAQHAVPQTQGFPDPNLSQPCAPTAGEALRSVALAFSSVSRHQRLRPPLDAGTPLCGAPLEPPQTGTLSLWLGTHSRRWATRSQGPLCIWDQKKWVQA